MKRKVFLNVDFLKKNAGIDDFEIAEVHSMKAPDSENEDVVSKDETLNLNTYELENKSPFCSTPRLSLLTPVPFPSIEASRISANPARINRWISRLGEVLMSSEKKTICRKYSRTIDGDF